MSTAASPSETYAYDWVGPSRHHHYTIPSILELLPAESGLTVLDAACGNGYIANEIRKLGHTVYGCELADSGLALARRSYPEITFFKQDLYEDMRQSLPEGGVDVVVASEVIEHMFAPTKFLENLRRTLKPGGHVILTTPYHGFFKNLAISLVNGWDNHFMVHHEGGHIKFYSPKTLKAVMRETGFDEFEFRGLGRAPLIWAGMAMRGRKIRS